MNKEQEKLLFDSGYKKMDIVLASSNYETMDQAFAFNDEEIQLDPDLMFARFIMCHEGENANGDYFTKDVLYAAQKTPKHKPIDWEHGQPFIGTILDSAYREDASGRGYIEAIGVVWKFIYPELSSDIKAKASTGELKLSMECYYRDANYKIGDSLYTQSEAEELGLIQYVGREYMGQKVYRVFNEVIFGGVGVVANPADKAAVFLSVAKDLRGHNIPVNVDNVDEAMVNLSSQIATVIERSFNDFNKKKPDKETVEAVAVAKYVSAFDKAKSTIVGAFNKDALKDKSQLISEISKTIDQFLREVSSINQDFYKGVATDLTAEAKDVFIDEMLTALQRELYEYYSASFDGHIEAYIKKATDSYIIYALVDYRESYPNEKLMRADYALDDQGNASIQFSEAVELEIVYQVKSSIQEDKEDNQEMNDGVASQEPVVEQEKPEVAAVVETQEAEVETVDYKAEASRLETELASVNESLASEKEKSATLEARVSELEGKLGEIESQKVAEARVAELKELGIVLSESRASKLKGMSDEEYSDFKELLVEVAGAKATEQEEADTVSASDESESEIEEEIVVEKPAHASINIESETLVSKSPFSHLLKR